MINSRTEITKRQKPLSALLVPSALDAGLKPRPPFLLGAMA
jgi:hypothetical protein